LEEIVKLPPALTLEVYSPSIFGSNHDHVRKSCFV